MQNQSQIFLRANSHDLGQRIYFYHNHPIRLVRLVGLVVAFDVFPNRFIFILDDSSGRNIEVTCGRPTCSLATLPNDETERNANTPIQEKVRNELDADMTGTTATGNTLSMNGVDIGTVVKVKGLIGDFRGEKQILLERIWTVGTTNEEALCWVELCLFKSCVLDKPWVVNGKDEKRARRAAEGKGTSRGEEVTNRNENHRADKSKHVTRRHAETESRSGVGLKTKHTEHGRTDADERAKACQEHIERLERRNGNSGQLPTRSESVEVRSKRQRIAESTNSKALPVIANKKIQRKALKLCGNHCGDGTSGKTEKHLSRNIPFTASAGNGDVQDKVLPPGLIQTKHKSERDRSWAEGKFDALGF